MKEKSFTLISGTKEGFYWSVMINVQENGNFHGKNHFRMTYSNKEMNTRFKRWYKTPEGNLNRKKMVYKHRNLGCTRIGLEIPNCVNHHLTTEWITSVPKLVHEKFSHNGPTMKLEGVIG